MESNPSLTPWSAERLARLGCASFPGFGSRRMRMLRKSFSLYQHAWSASVTELVAAGLSESIAQKFVTWRSTAKPEAWAYACAIQDIQIIFLDDQAYPPTLRTSSDPPEILFVRGNIPHGICVAVVGTRRVTPYGKRATEELVRPLARHGICIVSGLALGIDGLAHEAALAEHGKTIAILGTGIDNETIYPRTHLQLAHQIIKSGGAVISEFPPKTPSRKEHFPMRNRIIASLSEATVVVEAAAESGSLITAKLALEENREVLAVPGPIWNENSAGCHHLLKLGAKVCTNATDILDALAYDRPELLAEARTNLPLDPHESAILQELKTPKHIDELARIMAQETRFITSALSFLELKGYAKPIGGQIWVRTQNAFDGTTSSVLHE